MKMTPREATELAERFVKTWPTGPKQGIWFDVLTEHCEREPAWQVYRQHRDTDERAPSIAGFLATYRRHVGRDHADRARHPRCPTCDGTGLRSASQVIGGVEHSVVVACADCPNGIAAARTLVAIDTANAQSNAATRRHHGPVVVAPSPHHGGEPISLDEALTRLDWRAKLGDDDDAQDAQDGLTKPMRLGQL